MKYFLIILLAVLLLGDDPPDSIMVDTVRIQQQKAIELTKKSRAQIQQLIKELKAKQDTTKKE